MIAVKPKKMIDVDVQLAISMGELPPVERFKYWAEVVLKQFHTDTEIVLRIVGLKEITDLNKAYRRRDGPTNVLSFGFEKPANIPINLLGDVVICASVVKTEARDQAKSFEARLAHMVVHGTLHLLGFDHIEKAEAKAMENQEIRFMEILGFANPYEQVVPI